MRFLKRFKWNKRKILTVTTVLLVFVMSLGYAALSQYMDIDGVAMIDRSWIVKVTNVESSVTGEGVNNSSSYASTTVTMNATLPTSTSTVTYTITLENQGNLVAKLSTIDKIEDDNTSITYEISGVTIEETILKPGETNIVTVTIKYPSGTTSVGNTVKSLMLTFNYVEDSSQSITGGNNSQVGTNNTVYKTGDKVTLLNGQEGYVVQDSGKNNEMVSVFLPNQIANMPYDTSGSTDYNPGSNANIAYYMNTTYAPTIKSSLIEVGGDATGLSARLITQSEIGMLILKGIIPTQTTWTMTSASDTEIYTYTGSKTLSKLDPTSSYNVAPVVVMLKSNIIEPEGNHLSAEILGENNSNVVSSGNGLYVSTATDDGRPTYYYKGNVTNNYVKLGTQSYSIEHNGYCSLTDYYKKIYGDLELSDYITDQASCLSPSNNAFICDRDSSGSGYEITSYCYEYDVSTGNEIKGIEISLTGKTEWIPAGTKTIQEELVWRVVRINEDGTVKIILSQGLINDEIVNSYFYEYSPFRWHVFNNNADLDKYEYYSESDIDGGLKKTVDNWYSSNLNKYDEYIATINFCEAYKTSSLSSYIPDFKCEKDSRGYQYVNTKIGLITLDEVMMASDVSYNHYLLDNHDGMDMWWTMSPSGGSDSMWGSGAGVWNLYSLGDIFSVGVDYLGGGAEGTVIRPVISLKADTLVTGSGTAIDPYVVKIN